MKVVLDTNVVLISIASRSPYRPIFDALLHRKFTLLLSNEILSEYIEIITQKASSQVATNMAELLVNLKNVEQTEIYYNWHLIEKDKDDNKFVDAAISSRADYLVTNDHHFDILKRIPFPKVEILNIEEFLELIDIQK
jgi:putative PIN family toxin of toxin-antitoxin system